MSIKFNIGNPESQSPENGKLLGKAGNWLYEKPSREKIANRTAGGMDWHLSGGLCYMVLEQALTPHGLRPKMEGKAVSELQEVLVRRLLKLGYVFKEQGYDAQKVIDKAKRELGLLPVEVAKPKTYSQTRTVTVVLERNGFTYQQAVDADENFGGDNAIENMKADGFKAVSATYNKHEGRVSHNAGIGFFGWKEEND